MIVGAPLVGALSSDMQHDYISGTTMPDNTRAGTRPAPTFTTFPNITPDYSKPAL